MFIVGINGNMGRRYKAIAEHLNIGVSGVDINDNLPNKKTLANKIIFLCTPTDNHIQDILWYFTKSNCQIVCEKPISKIYKEFTKLFDYSDRLLMVNNYNYIMLGHEVTKKPTTYNYYTSGKDGLYWDCIQIIHLARGKVLLSNKSPIWKCIINGVEINRSEIDLSYVYMIKDIFGEQKYVWGMDDILLAHQKVEKLIKSKGK